MSLILSGGSTEKDAALKKSEVNHLRLMLAWLRCEYMLDDDMQKGCADAVTFLLDAGEITEEQAVDVLSDRAAKVRHVPLYVRQAVKMLTKKIRDHEKRGGIVDGESYTIKQISLLAVLTDLKEQAK